MEFGEAIKNPAYRIPQTEYSGCLDISAHSVAREVVTYFFGLYSFNGCRSDVPAAIIVLVSKCLLLYNKEIFCRHLRLFVVEAYVTSRFNRNSR